MKKTTSYFLLAVVLTASSFVISSCGGPKKVAYTSDAKEVKLPLAGNDYKSDDNYYRVVSNGKSPDIAMAEKIALTNAQSKMASMIKSLVQNCTEQYRKQTSDQNSIEFGQDFQTMDVTAANETISNAKIKESKVLQYDNKSYEYWICLEVNKKELVENSLKKMSKSKVLQIEENRDKFRKIFETEVNKLN